MVTEERRARLAREGDLSAFNELVVEYQALVYNVCYRMLGQAQAAEDAAQEAFVSAWRNIGTLRGEAFRPWVLRIAANLCRDELRRRVRRPSSSLDVALEAGVPEPPDEDPLPEDTALNAELRAGLDAALAALPDDQRTAIVLCDVDGLDYSEIAAVMKTSLGTVKSRIARGRLRLREALLRQPELLPGRFRQGD
ncbi:MAG TPA: sigma-70 family RNA polymerase sigma factor [Dehalococcoidia bacterium]